MKRCFGKSPFSLSRAAYGGGRKRIFIGLLSASCLALCLLLFIFLIFPWLVGIPAWLPPASVGLGSLLIFVLAWLCLALVYHLYTGRPIPGIHALRHVLIRLFLPLMQIIGRIFGFSRATVLRSFVKVNNELVLASRKRAPGEKMLVLVPHCLQASRCPRRLTHTPQNCLRCGSCPIGSILKLHDERNFVFAVATGGTIARRIVVAARPACILAVACERDLASGIQDCYPIPVFGILNDRPNGPCMDTLVDVARLEAALDLFLEGGDAPAK